MGKRLKEEYEFLKTVQHELGVPRIIAGRTVYDDSRNPSDAANWLISYSGQLLWMCVVYDMHRRYCDQVRVRPVTWKKLMHLLVSLDVISWLRAMDDLDGILLAYVSQRCKSVEEGLRKLNHTRPKGDVAKFTTMLRSLLTPEFHALMSKNDIEAFRVLHQIFAFPKRLSLELKMLKDSAYNTWRAIEEEKTQFPPDMEIERDILSEWFPKSREAKILHESFLPRHGPGAVVEGCKTLGEKFLALHFTPSQVNFLDTYQLWENVMDGCLSQPYLSRDPIELSTDSICETVWVKKSWKTFRTISKETVTNQWLQQGVGHCIDDELRFGKSGLSYWYALSTEDVNRWLAYEGSIDGNYATIDLSAASDRIALEHFDTLFADTWLWDCAHMCRSPYTTARGYEDQPRLQRKFAPMGSRLCFPVESAIFAAICEGCVRENLHIPTYRLQRTAPIGAVYGDDIVIRYDLFDAVMTRLVQFGFVPNERKSYGNTDGLYFRESCGIECLNGTDVTPVLLSREFPGFSADAEVCVPNLMELANACYDHNLTCTRTAILYHLLENLKFPIPFSKDGLGMVKSPADSNHHLRVTWREDYQHAYFEAARIVPVWSRISWTQDRTTADAQWDSQEGCDIDQWSMSAKLYEWLRTHPGNTPLRERCLSYSLPDSESVATEYGKYPIARKVGYCQLPTE